MEWEQVYADGHCERAPFDEVVSFVYQNLAGREPKSVHICEVGCGSGANLEFLHNQGFRVYGVDSSLSAIGQALAKVPLPNRILTGDFHKLPFEDNSFDMVIDRAALWYTDAKGLDKAIAEVHRVLRKGGSFLFTPCYEHVDQRFPINYIQSEEEIHALLADKFGVAAVDLVTIYDVLNGQNKVAYFRVTARKE